MGNEAQPGMVVVSVRWLMARRFVAVMIGVIREESSGPWYRVSTMLSRV